MPERELYSSDVRVEQEKEPTQTRRGLRGLAERAMHEYTFLGEVASSHDEERAYLQRHVIGQEAAIEAIITALDRRDVRRHDDMRPIASLAFLGPTGVGKTEMAKALSQILDEDTQKLLRFDCSGFSQDHEVATLTGSPPGFVSRHQKPGLHKENVEDASVILFDEVEKGSKPLFDLLLQIMDNGRIILNDGSKTSFRNKVIVLTSNLGAREMNTLVAGSRAGFAPPVQASDKKSLEAVATKSFKEFFAPEFVNRLDNLAVFHALSEDEMHGVLDVKLGFMNETYRDEFGAYLSLTPQSRKHLVAQAMADPAFGVRPLVRALDTHVAALFGRYTASEMIPDGSEVMVYHRDEVTTHIHEGYPHDLVFAIRADESAKKYVAPPMFQAGVTSNSVELLPRT